MQFGSSVQHRIGASPATHFLFVEDLHGVVVLLVFVLRQHHPPERARPEGLHPVEVLQACCVLKQTNIPLNSWPKNEEEEGQLDGVQEK